MQIPQNKNISLPTLSLSMGHKHTGENTEEGLCRSEVQDLCGTSYSMQIHFGLGPSPPEVSLCLQRMLQPLNQATNALNSLRLEDLVFWKSF